ncbi:Bad [Phodopus roborovskii]|uniref:Bad protein n=1 Tax=Phodopus roborovskii TaxID=109678 RepID=A0AAU9ZNV4_PHORO|nr:Bad [Phodopus roborovskii]
MFQIPEFEPSEQEDSSTADRRLGLSLTGDQSGPCLAPGLLGSIGHQQEQTANSSHHGGVGAMETRSRHSSYTAGNEEDEGMEEELSPFRGRSRSAPPNLWAAQRYGRELRRMSDEFEGSFKVSAREMCDGTYTHGPLLSRIFRVVPLVLQGMPSLAVLIRPLSCRSLTLGFHLGSQQSVGSNQSRFLRACPV